MESAILRSIKYFKYKAILGSVYYVVYNTYFGWNKLPINRSEEIADGVFAFLLGVMLASFINIVISFIKFQMEKAIYELNKEYYDK